MSDKLPISTSSTMTFRFFFFRYFHFKYQLRTNILEPLSIIIRFVSKFWPNHHKRTSIVCYTSNGLRGKGNHSVKGRLIKKQIVNLFDRAYTDKSTTNYHLVLVEPVNVSPTSYKLKLSNFFSEINCTPICTFCA